MMRSAASPIFQALDYDDRHKFHRPTARIRLGWLFPALAVLSLLMNASLHAHSSRLRKNNVFVNEMERGPPATTTPKRAAGKKTRAKAANAGRRRAKKKSPGTTTQALKSQKQQKKTEPKATPTKRGGSHTVETKPLDTPVGKVSHANNKQAPARKLKPDSTTADKSQKMRRARKEKKQMSAKKEAPKDKEETSIAIRVKEKSTNDPKPKTSKIKVTKESTAPDAAFSACLLIRDDNEILNEWIAYHYHALRMTRLIVAVDPNSETSPAPLLENWKDLMKIDIWTDDMYMSKEFLETGKPPEEDIKVLDKFNVTKQEMLEINTHRYRQRYFLTECFKKLKKEHRTWVAHIDTDEYVVPNKLMREDQEKNNIEIRSAAEPGSILKLIQKLVKADADMVNYPCFTMIRLFYGSVESADDKGSTGSLSLPSNFERRNFETLRWRHHGPALDKTQSGFPKVLVDVSRIHNMYFKKIVWSIHRPFKSFCRGQGDVDYGAYDKFPISTNHYLGSWERYSARNDKRRSSSAYNQKANVDDGEDTWIEGWLEGFIKDVGVEQASRVLGSQYLNTATEATS